MNISEIKTEDLDIGEVYIDKLRNKNVGKLKTKIILGYNNKSEKKPYYKLIFEKDNASIMAIRDYDYVFFKGI